MRRVLAGIRAYLRELAGEAEYDKYVERHRHRHPAEPVLSRREFERRRCDRRDDNPTVSCC